MGESSAAYDVLARKLSRYTSWTREETCHLMDLLSRPLRRVNAREDIFVEGEATDNAIMIVSGWAFRHKLLQDGRRQILTLFFPGDFCGLRNFLLESPDFSIATFTPTVILELPKDIVLRLTEGPSRIARAIWWSALVGEAIERERTVSLGQRDARERLGHLLCEIFLRQRSLGLTNGPVCDFPLRQSDLADACGLSIVHVNRSLKELRALKMIEFNQRTLIIRNFTQLASASLFNPSYLHLNDADTSTPPDARAAGQR